MSDLLDNYTQGEKIFIWNVENNRGEIKNKDKFYPILADIYDNAVQELKEHATHLKMIGLQKLHKYTTTLTIPEQEEFAKQVGSMTEFRTAAKIDEVYSDVLRAREGN